MRNIIESILDYSYDYDETVEKLHHYSKNNTVEFEKILDCLVFKYSENGKVFYIVANEKTKEITI